MTSAPMRAGLPLAQESPAPQRARLAAAVAVVVLVHLLAGVFLLRHQDVFQMKSESAAATGAPIRVTMVSIARPLQPAPPVPPKPEVKKVPTVLAVKAPAARLVTAQAKSALVLPSPPLQTVPLAAAPAAPAAAQVAPLPGPPTIATPKTLSAGEFKKLACRIPAPVYPAKAKRLHEEGSVVLRVQIDTQGNFAQVQVTQGSGYGELDHAALDAMRAGSCQPYQEEGVSRMVEASQRIDFSVPD